MTDLVATAEALYDVVAGGADEAERLRRLPPATVEALVDAGMMQLCLPAVYGGPEADPLTMISVVEALARADGAAGWCAMIAATTASQALFVPPEAVREIYSGPDIVGGGVFAPNGTGRVDGDTITVSGRWQWGSGSQHSHWIVAGTMCDDDTFRLCWFDARDVEFHDTWYTAGLRGTGSLDFSVADVAVPVRHSFQPFLTPPTVDAPLGAFPNFSLLAVGVAATSLGIARRALDELVALAEGKRPLFSSRTLAESAHTAIELARAEAALRSARAFLHDEVGRCWDAVLAGSRIDVPARIGLRLAGVNAASRGAEVADAAYTLAGGSSVYESNVLQRCLRDAHVVTQHMQVAPKLHETLGKVLLGKDADVRAL